MHFGDRGGTDQGGEVHTAVAHDIAFGAIRDLHGDRLAVQSPFNERLTRHPISHEGVVLFTNLDARFAFAELKYDWYIVVTKNYDPVLAELLNG